MPFRRASPKRGTAFASDFSMRHELTHEDSRSAYPDECQSEQEMIDELQASLLEEATAARKVKGHPSDARIRLASHSNELLTKLEQLSWRRYFNIRPR